MNTKSLFKKGKSKNALEKTAQLIHLIFASSENIERYRKIIQQRIVAVKEEASRKYGNLLESIPSRLEQIVQHEETEEDVTGENIEN